MPLLFQTVMLFGFGLAFGLLITQLHKSQQITPVPVPIKGNRSWYYQASWGVLGVIIGNALPRIDAMFQDEEVVSDNFSPDRKPIHNRSASHSSRSEKEHMSLADSGLGPFWYSTVRSIGAFVGIAFALVSSSALPH